MSSLKHESTFKIIQYWIKSMEDYSPINISFITQPISTSLTSRIETLELLYNKSSLYRYLLKKGVYPFLLFSTVSGGIGYGFKKTYNRSTQLVLNVLGVLYPAICCWQMVKNEQPNQEELKSWLTYWMLFGSFQVLDHWIESDLFLFSKRKYNLCKLFILYWAQNPHSKGAQLLYRHVIQKPSHVQAEEAEERTILFKQEKNAILFKQGEEEEEEEEERHSYLDGYQPPNLSPLSASDDSIGSATTLSQEKEKLSFSPLLLTTLPTIESACW